MGTSAAGGMYQLAVRLPDRSLSWVAIPTFPFTLGRAASASLRLDVPGIWDRHLELVMDRESGLMAVPAPNALVRHGGELIARHRVRMGDEFELGPVVIRVALTPPRRRSLTAWEWFLGLVFLLVLAAQAWAAIWLIVTP